MKMQLKESESDIWKKTHASLILAACVEFALLKRVHGPKSNVYNLMVVYTTREARTKG
jgi:hypothetical protein